MLMARMITQICKNTKENREKTGAAFGRAHNPVNHNKQKHIDIAFHFVRELVESKTINVVPVSTELELADLFTKTLPAPRFEFLVDMLRGKSFSSSRHVRL